MEETALEVFEKSAFERLVEDRMIRAQVTAQETQLLLHSYAAMMTPPRFLLDPETVQAITAPPPRRMPSPVPMPRPYPVPVRLLDMSTEEREYLAGYQARAAAIGYHCAEVWQRLGAIELLEFLHAELMPIYNYEQVRQYMDAMVRQLNMDEDGRGWDPDAPIRPFRRPTRFEWGWLPLRACDVKKVGQGDKPRYTKPIPPVALETAEKLAKRFGEDVILEVTEVFNVPKPDPFLSVCAVGDRTRYVVERWDEPSFRDKR